MGDCGVAGKRLASVERLPERWQALGLDALMHNHVRHLNSVQDCSVTADVCEYN